MNSIQSICALEVLDSRGNPTVETVVKLKNGEIGAALVPSGASTGKHEAYELRDNDPSRYNKKGVLRAVKNINTVLNEALEGCPICQSSVDTCLIRTDGTFTKEKMGANAILSVSLAAARAGAQDKNIQLFQYLGGINAKRMPVPLMNVLNGGVHASNDLDVQEVMIVPVGFNRFSEALRCGCEIYHALGRILKADKKVTSVGDEGGYAPDVGSLECAIEYLIRAIKEAGYDTERVKVSIDCAAGEWYREDGTYLLPKCGAVYTAAELCSYYSQLCERYPIFSIEDGLSDDDMNGWQYLTKELSERVLLVGDDLFVTSTSRLKDGIEKGIANAILIKPNQVGTLSETMEVMRLAKENGYKTIVSHRSGDTEDTFIADLAVGMNAGYIKCGAPSRSERTAKYNRLLFIEGALPLDTVYGAEQY